MKRRNLEIFILALLTVLLISSACEKDPILSPILDETIIIQNRSGINGVRVYIDDNLKGIVDNGKDLELHGDYGGRRKFHAEGGNCIASPSYHDVPENGTFIWELGPGSCH